MTVTVTETETIKICAVTPKKCVYVTVYACCCFISVLSLLQSLNYEATTTQLSTSSISSSSLWLPRDRKGPFTMPIQGATFSIFQPLYDMRDADKDPQIISNVKDVINIFKKRIAWAKSMVNESDYDRATTGEDQARSMYFEMMKNFVSAAAYNNAEISVGPRLGPKKLRIQKINPKIRQMGGDWTFAGDTMTGPKRLDNVKDLILNVTKENIEGDYIETGVWRGGSSIFARAVITALGQEKDRVSYVCDSFAGLPPGDKKLDVKDKGWDQTPYLEVPSEIVANGFLQYGLLDSNVVFAKGFFNETMPHLSTKIQKLSIMRLDVSTVLLT